MITHGRLLGDVIPIVDKVTMAATGSEYDNGAVISRAETNDKVVLGSEKIFPVASFVDPTYTYTLPKRQVLAGAADAFNHLLESYFNAAPNDLGDGMMESAMRSIIKTIRIISEDPENYDARAELFLDCTLACNGILHLGQASSGWPMHSMEHALSGYYGITHGEGLAILTPRWMRSILSEKTEGRFAKYGRNVFGISSALSDREAAERSIDMTYELFDSLGIPMNLRKVGIDESRLAEMAHHVVAYDETDDPSMYVPLSEEDVLEIYRASL